MKLLTRALLIGGLTETFFITCLFLGEEPDVDQGDLAGWLGLVGHLPVAFLLWLLKMDLSLDMDFLRFPLALVGWIVFWWIVFAVFRSRREQLSSGTVRGD